MFFYGKKVVYLSLFQGEKRKGPAGFIRMVRERDGYRIEICVKQEDQWPDDKYPLFLIQQSEEVFWGAVAFRQGTVTEKKFLMVDAEEYVRIGGKKIPVGEITGMRISFGEQYIAGSWREEKQSISGREDKEDPPEEIQHPKIQPQEIQRQEIQAQEQVPIAFKEEDKWKRLQSCYKQMHPFGDQRCFIAIEPKDFTILKEPYQRLVNNSFLLHGFYNYRHIIVGQDKELKDGEETCFYLGVPGTYFEREKMVAVMFGFEGFECDGAVEIGKFGYYMRRVEL